MLCGMRWVGLGLDRPLNRGMLNALKVLKSRNNAFLQMSSAKVSFMRKFAFLKKPL